MLAIAALAHAADRERDHELDDLPEPPSEIVRDPAPVVLPAIPVFDRPTALALAPADDAAVAGAEPAVRAAVDPHVRDVSVVMLNACSREITARRYDEAITACRAAIELWRGNHLAWYGLASAHLARRAWQAAEDAIAHAVALRPDRAMYQMYDGIARYEAATEAATETATEHAPDSVRPAIGPLLRAIRREPALWRAHYYLGRIYRDRDDARAAAAEFTAAIAANPGRRDCYVALSELYRRRGHPDAALAVALRGTEHVRSTDAADLWFEAALAYDAQRLAAPAIAAYGQVLALRPRDDNARLQRGQLQALRGELADARADLELVIASSEPELAAVRALAHQLLDQIAAWEHLPRSVVAQVARRLVLPQRTQP